MILIEVVAAGLLVLGSVLIIRAVVASDARGAGAAQPTLRKDPAADCRRAA